MIYIQIYLLVWFWCSFEPLTDLIDYLWHKLPQNITKYKLVDYLYILLSCQKCLTFWTTIILTGNIFGAIFLSMIADIQKKLTK
jgi:hypothetical protein